MALHDCGRLRAAVAFGMPLIYHKKKRVFERKAFRMADQIIVYSGPGCADCQRVKELLTNKGVDFETRDVFANKEYREDVEKLGFMGIPVTVVGDRAIKGFDKEALLELLAGR